MQKIFFFLFISLAITVNSVAIIMPADDINDHEEFFISSDNVDQFGNLILDNISDNLTTIADELDIFIFDGIELSVNIPSSIFYRAKNIHNNPTLSDYEKRIEFYYLTVEAIDKFYDYVIELTDGARDIENCEDEVEALLSFMQIIYNNDHNYKDLVQLETLEKMDEIFQMIDTIVKKQITDEMSGKQVYYSILDTPQMAYPLGADKSYLSTIILNEAKQIHQSNLSQYQKKRDMLYLIYNQIGEITSYVSNFNSGKLDKVELKTELLNLLIFLQLIDNNNFDYRELIPLAEIENIQLLIYNLEILLELREEPSFG